MNHLTAQRFANWHTLLRDKSIHLKVLLKKKKVLLERPDFGGGAAVKTKVSRCVGGVYLGNKV